MSRRALPLVAALALLGGCGGTGVDAPVRVPPGPGLHPVVAGDPAPVVALEEHLDACGPLDGTCVEVECCNGSGDAVTGTCP